MCEPVDAQVPTDLFVASARHVRLHSSQQATRPRSATFLAKMTRNDLDIFNHAKHDADIGVINSAHDPFANIVTA
jgi:hypothetical protein